MSIKVRLSICRESIANSPREKTSKDSILNSKTLKMSSTFTYESNLHNFKISNNQNGELANNRRNSNVSTSSNFKNVNKTLKPNSSKVLIPIDCILDCDQLKRVT